MFGGLGIQKRKGSAFPAMTLPGSVRGWQSTWFYCQDVETPGQLTGLPHFSFDRVQTPAPLKVTAGEIMETRMLVDRVVQLINDGVTGLDLLEVFLSRRIQPLQARDHPMWVYSGPDDTARTHPEEVPSETVASWLRSITCNQDNPRGSRRVVPFSSVNPPDKVLFSFRLFLIHAPTALDIDRLSLDQFAL